MTKRHRRGVTPPAFPQPPPIDAHFIPPTCERIACDCAACDKRFCVNAELLRIEEEIETRCPHCKNKMLIQHVEYAVAILNEK